MKDRLSCLDTCEFCTQIGDGFRLVVAFAGESPRLLPQVVALVLQQIATAVEDGESARVFGPTEPPQDSSEEPHRATSLFKG